MYPHYLITQYAQDLLADRRREASIERQCRMLRQARRRKARGVGPVATNLLAWLIRRRPKSMTHSQMSAGR